MRAVSVGDEIGRVVQGDDAGPCLQERRTPRFLPDGRQVPDFKTGRFQAVGGAGTKYRLHERIKPLGVQQYPARGPGETGMP